MAAGQMAPASSRGTFKILRGLVFAEVEQSSGSIVTLDEGITGDGEFVFRRAGFDDPSKGGSGFALDLGVAAEPYEGLTLSLALQNLAGQITWQDDVVRERAFFRADTTNAADLLVGDDTEEEGFDRLLSAEFDTLEASFSDPHPVEGTPRWDPGFSFTADYPTLLRLGAAYQVHPTDLLLAFEYEQGFSDNPGVSKTPRLSFGGEYTPFGFLALRLGFAAGGVFDKVSSLGLGLRGGPLRFDIASAVQGAYLPNNAEGVGFALNLGLDF